MQYQEYCFEILAALNDVKIHIFDNRFVYQSLYSDNNDDPSSYNEHTKYLALNMPGLIKSHFPF